LVPLYLFEHWLVFAKLWFGRRQSGKLKSFALSSRSGVSCNGLAAFYIYAVVVLSAEGTSTAL
jgi:hypothetical protein